MHAHVLVSRSTSCIRSNEQIQLLFINAKIVGSICYYFHEFFYYSATFTSDAEEYETT